MYKLNTSKVTDEFRKKFSIKAFREASGAPVIEDYMEQLASSDTEIDLVEKLFGTEGEGGEL